MSRTTQSDCRKTLLLRAQAGAPADSAGLLDSLSLGLALLPSASNVKRWLNH